MRASGGLTTILLPVFNDWRALSLLLPRLAQATGAVGPIGILVVDDGSNDRVPEGMFDQRPAHVQWLRVLRLRRNVGHQRAIAIGLCHIYEHIPCDHVVVMDADGEDRPEDVPILVSAAKDGPISRIVFAERRRRAENLIFRVFYKLYRLLHRALIGSGVKVGNFSVIPIEQLASLVVVSELWIHYAAAAFRSRQPLILVPTERGHRLDGRSRMNFVSLVIHGLSAISVYSDVVFTRLVVAASVVTAMVAVLLCTAVGIRLFTTVAIPGWATSVVGLLSIILLQAVIFAVALTFQVLGSRHLLAIVPQRDYSLLVGSVRDLGPTHSPTA